MNHKLIAPKTLLLALAAAILLVTTATAADKPEKAPATRQAAILVARADVAPQQQHLDAENLETPDSALSRALERLALDNKSELEKRISDRTFVATDSGK